ncbi:hypothetical protein BB561_004456 [Smittium simulii]|uniref:Uncharacterized protein n=1 Tax=Smittium simulii TaxID=133385 RepID=A0A2T9YG43_9FUNG|nr:hypothetical protein BB561_004456 [Smittium simulii]
MCWNCGIKSYLKRDCNAADNHWRRKPKYNSKENLNSEYQSGKAQHQEKKLSQDIYGVEGEMSLSAPQIKSPPKESITNVESNNKIFKNTQYNSDPDMDLEYFSASGNIENFNRPVEKSKKKYKFSIFDNLIQPKAKLIRVSLIDHAETIQMENINIKNPNIPIWTMQSGITEMQNPRNRSEYLRINCKWVGYRKKKTTKLTISLENCEISISAFIFPLKNVDLILGIDWWVKYKLTPQYETNTWKIEVDD